MAFMTSHFRSLRSRLVFVAGGLVFAVLASRAYSLARDAAPTVPEGERGAASHATAGLARPAEALSDAVAISLPDSLFGRSGALRFATLLPAEANALPGFVDHFGEEALHTPAVRAVRAHTAPGTPAFSLLVLKPFGAKRGDVLNGYRLGRWPAERWMMQRNYFNPDGFVEVTPANVELPLSARFRLGDFLTHDQNAVWPKYVIVEERLIDKLELVARELEATGIRADRTRVLSGFRAPYYNERWIDEGAARASRHQYGDAADVIVDNDGDGRMDDLNGDGRVDLRDVKPVVDAVARVDRRYPELVGGLGTYAAMGPAGPFAHVDVRGTSARWERARGGR